MLSVNKTYSTKEAARKVGVHWVTLHKWMAAGKVRPSHQIGMNGGKHWRWTERDIKNARKYKAKHYWKKKTPRKRDSKARANELK